MEFFGIYTTTMVFFDDIEPKGASAICYAKKGRFGSKTYPYGAL